MWLRTFGGIVLAMFATSEAVAQTCRFSTTDLNFAGLSPATMRGATIRGILDAHCVGSPGQTLRICPRFLEQADANPLRSAEGETLPFRFMSASNEIIGSDADVPALDVVIGPGGTGQGSLVFGARMETGVVSPAAGRYAARFAGATGRVTYGEARLGSCRQQDQRLQNYTAFFVSATIEATCTLSPGRLDFGSITSLRAPVDTQTVVTIRCTRGTSYEIALEGGNGGGRDPARRQLVSGPDVLTYAVYRDAGRRLPWGSTGNGIAGTGTGNMKPVYVYGRIDAQFMATPGQYADRLIMSVRY